MRVVFSDRAYAAVLAETTEKIKTETGGLLLGKFQDDEWYVIEAIDPGPKSVFQVAYFEYDQQYTQHLINKIANLYDVPLSLIGLWHRHPGSLDQFSSTDDGTNSKYANMRPEGAISGLVNIDPVFRLTMYHVLSPCKYSKISYVVGDDLIPGELLKYKSVDRFTEIMNNLMSERVSSLHIKKSNLSLRSFLEKISSSFKEYKEMGTNSVAVREDDKEPIDILLDSMIEDITYMSDELGINLTITQNDQYICVQDSGEIKEKIYFKCIQPEQQIVFAYGDKCYEYSPKLFQTLFVKSKNERPKYYRNVDKDSSFSISGTVRKILHKTINGDE